jgi:hypothetical protein
VCWKVRRPVNIAWAAVAFILLCLQEVLNCLHKQPNDGDLSVAAGRIIAYDFGGVHYHHNSQPMVVVGYVERYEEL